MSFIAWIVLGALAGWIASMFMKTNAEQGILGNIIVGILGAVIGGFLFDFFGAAGVTGFNLYSLLVAIVGAAILLWLVRMVRST